MQVEGPPSSLLSAVISVLAPGRSALPGPWAPADPPRRHGTSVSCPRVAEKEQLFRKTFLEPEAKPPPQWLPDCFHSAAWLLSHTHPVRSANWCATLHSHFQNPLPASGGSEVVMGAACKDRLCFAWLGAHARTLSPWEESHGMLGFPVGAPVRGSGHGKV